MRDAFIGVCVALLSVGCFAPDGARPELQLSLDAATAYVHRGMPQNQNAVVQGGTQVIMPTRGGGSVGLRSWTNIDLTRDKGDAWFPDGGRGHPSQFDLVADYAHNFGPVGVTAGVAGYSLPRGESFPNGPRGATTELFVRVDAEVLTLNPSLQLNFDVDAADGFYANAAVARGFVLNDKLDANVSVSLGYSDSKHSLWAYDFPTSGVADLRVQGVLGYVYDEHTNLNLTLAGSTMIDGTLQDWFDVLGIDSDNLWLSVGGTWSY